MRSRGKPQNFQYSARKTLDRRFANKREPMSKNARDASSSEPEQPSEEKVKEVSPNKVPPNKDRTGFTRRSFIARLSASGVAAASTLPLLQNLVAAQVETSPASVPAGAAPRVPMVLNVNGRDYRLKLEPRVTLLDALREHLNFSERRKDATTASAAHARCTSTDAA